MGEIDLQGLRVLNTRPREQGELLNQVITKAHGHPIHFPALEIAPPTQDWLPVLPSLQLVHHAIFTSPNAVDYACKRLKNWPRSLLVSAIGKSTALALAEYGISVSFYPEIADSEHFLQWDKLHELSGQRILLFKGEGGLHLIPETLKKRGGELVILDVYRRKMPDYDKKEILSWWRDITVDIILFTSQQAIENMVALLGGLSDDSLINTPCVVVSERLAKVAQSFGMKTIRVCRIHNLLASLSEFNKELRDEK